MSDEADEDESETELSESDLAAVGMLSEDYSLSGLAGLAGSSVVSGFSVAGEIAAAEEHSLSESVMSIASSDITSIVEKPVLSTLAADAIVDPSDYTDLVEPSVSAAMTIGAVNNPNLSTMATAGIAKPSSMASLGGIASTLVEPELSPLAAATEIDDPELRDTLISTAPLVAKWSDTTDFPPGVSALATSEIGLGNLSGLAGTLDLLVEADALSGVEAFSDLEVGHVPDFVETWESLDSSPYVPTIDDHLSAVPDYEFGEFSTELSSFEKEPSLSSQIEEYELKLRAYYAYSRTHEAIQALGDRVQTVYLIYISLIVTQIGQFLPQNKRIVATTIGTTAALAFHYKNSKTDYCNKD